jgi:hypothetical protein
MIRLETVEALIDKARLLQAEVDAGEVPGDDPHVRLAMRECLATVDAFLAYLPEAQRAPVGTALARRFLGGPHYIATVPPRRRPVARRTTV